VTNLFSGIWEVVFNMWMIDSFSVVIACNISTLIKITGTQKILTEVYGPSPPVWQNQLLGTRGNYFGTGLLAVKGKPPLV
jgi:hypothetical protein